MRLLPKLCGLAVAVTTSANARPLAISAPDWPPFYIHEGEDAPNRGFAWDILTTCGTRLDRNVTFEIYPIRRMFKQMEAGALDINVMSFKAERTATVDYGREIVFENTYSVWSGTSMKTKVTSLQDLDTMSVALLVGIHPSEDYKRWLSRRQQTPGAKETLILNEQEQIIKMLSSNRIDATVGSGPEIRWRARKIGLSSKIRETGLIIQKQPYFIVVSKTSPIYQKNPRILQRMDECVKDMKKSGEWLKLKERYQL